MSDLNEKIEIFLWLLLRQAVFSNKIKLFLKTSSIQLKKKCNVGTENTNVSTDFIITSIIQHGFPTI